MFGKVILFGLFEMIQKKKKELGPRPQVRVRPPGRVRYNNAGRHILVVSEPRFRRF